MAGARAPGRAAPEIGSSIRARFALSVIAPLRSRSHTTTDLARHHVGDGKLRHPVYPPDQWILEKAREPHAAVALHFMHYDFARIHKTLRVTAAMAAGVSDHVWSVEEIVGLLG